MKFERVTSLPVPKGQELEAMRFPTRNCVKNNDIPTQNDTKINGKIDEILIFHQNPPKMREISKKYFFDRFFYIL